MNRTFHGKRRPGSKLLLGVLLWTSAIGLQAAESVQALRYGTTLFHFYQQDYFNALTELTAAQSLEALDVHAGNAELLRGGMSLSYGMDQVAQHIFEQLLTEPSAAIEHNQAWFYLGKMAWQRGDAARASNNLAQLSSDYEGTLAEEANYLRASIDLRLGKPDAERYIDSMPDDSKWRYYLYYNLGATLAANGEWDESLAYLSAFEDAPRTPEMKALRDKAFTAAGFAHIKVEDYAGARDDFSRVRLTSPLSDRALLGYGWSALELGEFAEALAPWQVLTERSMLGSSARESLLAVPYAYEQLGRPGLALEQYQQATALYSDARTGLSNAISAFASGDLNMLLGIPQEIAGDWFFAADVMPEGEFAPYLKHLVARHDFQVAVRELRDLYSIAGHVRRADERLQVLSEVDAHQQQVWSAVLLEERQAELRQRQTILAQQSAVLRSEYELAVAAGDERLLADTEQHERWLRLEKAQTLAAAVDASAQKHAQLALYRGLMLFEDSEQYPTRLWQAQKQMEELEAVTAQTQEGLQRVQLAVAQQQSSNFAPRIVALRERVTLQAIDVKLAIAVSENGVRMLAVNELQREEQQLALAMGRSSLAIARLYDQGSLEIQR